MLSKSEVWQFVWNELHVQICEDSITYLRESIAEHQDSILKCFISELKSVLAQDAKDRKIQGITPSSRLQKYLVKRAWENLNKSLGHRLVDANLNESASGKQNANQKSGDGRDKSAGGG